MRVLWTHNFDPAKPNSQVYMNTAAEGLRRRGLDLHLEYLGNLRSLPQLARARRHVRSLARDFDLVHAQYGSACSIATATVTGVPKLVSLRGNDWSVHDEKLGFYFFHTRLARAMTRRTLRRYDCVIAVSRRMAREIKAFAPGIDVRVLPSPVDIERFVPRDRAEARAALGFPGSNEKWVLFNAIKLDDPIKRFDLAKLAFDLANARRGDLRFRVASDIPHDNVALFAAACDVILCTSETEGWPNSVKEALACNVPFVATDVSDLADIAAQEPTCRVCPPDAQALANAICEVLNGPRHPNLRKYLSDMTLESSTDQLVRFYESLLGRQGRGPRLAHAGVG